MTVQIATGAEVRREVAQLLLQHLTPAKLARFWADWQVGQGDYMDWRDEEFAAETVDSLYEKVLAFQAQTPQAD